MRLDSNVSNKTDTAMTNFYKAFDWDFDKLSLEDCHFLEENLTTILNSISTIIKNKTAKSKKKPKKGDEIQQFFFIGKTKNGCPKLEQRSVGCKGITHIEITNVGKSFFEDKHLTRVRVSGFKEDGKTPYQMYFNDVYTECSDVLLERFSMEVEKHKRALKCALKNAKTVFDKHIELMENDLSKITKKIYRKKYIGK